MREDYSANGDAWAFYKRMADKWGTKNFSPAVLERMKTLHGNAETDEADAASEAHDSQDEPEAA